ncbi:MAG: hypothetical protein ACTSQK_08200 [Candidatus Heimdallarchaeota archaeon]
MFRRLLGFKTMQRRVEDKIVQLSFIPSKYFEALYVECNTKIHNLTLDILEIEEKGIRGELLKLMKEGEVDTKIEIEKFQLFERINAVSTHSKEIREVMNTYVVDIKKPTYEKLVNILKEVSKAGKLMYQAIKELYHDYESSLEKVDELNIICNDIINGLFEFKFCDQDGVCEISFEEPEVFIGNALNKSLREMIAVGEKIVHIIRVFSYNHRHLIDNKESDDKPDENITKE